MDDSGSTNTATHPKPVWPSDSSIAADLSPFGMPGRFEEFRARRVSDSVFEISCIPFFTYGMALGDTVQVTSESVIRKIVKKSGRSVMRVAIAPRADLGRLHEPVHGWVESTGLLYEWHGPAYLAIDVPPRFKGNWNMSVLEPVIDAGDIVVEVDK